MTTPTYDPAAALAFALANALVVWAEAGTFPDYGWPATIRWPAGDFSPLSDYLCAEFVSRCLAAAGALPGLNGTEAPHVYNGWAAPWGGTYWLLKVANAGSGTPALYDALAASGYWVNVTGTPAQLQQQMQAGDVCYYPGDLPTGELGHVTLCVVAGGPGSVGRVASHNVAEASVVADWWSPAGPSLIQRWNEAGPPSPSPTPPAGGWGCSDGALIPSAWLALAGWFAARYVYTTLLAGGALTNWQSGTDGGLGVVLNTQAANATLNESQLATTYRLTLRASRGQLRLYSCDAASLYGVGAANGTAPGGPYLTPVPITTAPLVANQAWPAPMPFGAPGQWVNLPSWVVLYTTNWESLPVPPWIMPVPCLATLRVMRPWLLVDVPQSEGAFADEPNEPVVRGLWVPTDTAVGDQSTWGPPAADTAAMAWAALTSQYPPPGYRWPGCGGPLAPGDQTAPAAFSLRPTSARRRGGS